MSYFKLHDHSWEHTHCVYWRICVSLKKLNVTFQTNLYFVNFKVLAVA